MLCYIKSIVIFHFITLEISVSPHLLLSVCSVFVLFCFLSAGSFIKFSTSKENITQVLDYFFFLPLPHSVFIRADEWHVEEALLQLLQQDFLLMMWSYKMIKVMENTMLYDIGNKHTHNFLQIRGRVTVYTNLLKIPTLLDAKCPCTADVNIPGLPAQPNSMRGRQR